MSGTIQYIKISKIDQNGTDLTTQLESINTLTLPSGSGFAEYTIKNKTRYNDYFLYYVTPPNRMDIPDANKSNIVFNYEAPVKDQVTGMYNLVAGPFPVSLESNTPTISSEAFFIEQGTGIFENKFHSQIQTYPTESIHVSLNFTASRNLTNSETIAVALCKNSTFPTSTSTVLNTAGGLPATSSGHNTSGVTGTLTAETLLFPGEYIFAGLFKKSSSSNGLTAQLTGSLIISSSTQSGPTLQTVIEPYFTTDFYKSECDVLQNNATQGIPNTLLQKVDYSTNAMNPVNFEALISGTATNVDIPQSYFEVSSILNPSYNRSIVQSSDVNVYDNLARGTDFGDSVNRGTYGKTPSISSLDVNIYEFEWGGGTTPEILDYGAVKLGRILQVSSPEQVKTINKSDGAYTDLILSNKSTTVDRARNYRVVVESNLYPPESVSTASVGIKNFWITSQSRGDYYQILNSNNPVNNEISMYMYPNSTAGSQPTLPQSTKILNTEWGVPTISNYALTSSNAVSYGAIEGAGTDSFIQISGSVNISKVTTDSNGFYNSGNTIKPTWATIGDQINKDLNNGEKWFITLYNEFEFPNGQGDYNFPLTTGSLSPYNEGFTDIDSKGNYSTPLGFKGVFEIAGTYDEKALAGSNTFNFLLVDTFPVSARGKKIGGGVAGNSLGMLIWKARATGKNEFVLVQDSITGGVQEGAFINRFTPSYIIENFETITKEFGTNQTG